MTIELRCAECKVTVIGTRDKVPDDTPPEKVAEMEVDHGMVCEKCIPEPPEE